MKAFAKKTRPIPCTQWIPNNYLVTMSSSPYNDGCFVTNDLRSLLCGIIESPFECQGRNVGIKDQYLEVQVNKLKADCRPWEYSDVNWLYTLTTLSPLRAVLESAQDKRLISSVLIVAFLLAKIEFLQRNFIFQHPWQLPLNCKCQSRKNKNPFQRTVG